MLSTKIIRNMFCGFTDDFKCTNYYMMCRNGLIELISSDICRRLNYEVCLFFNVEQSDSIVNHTDAASEEPKRIISGST